MKKLFTWLLRFIFLLFGLIGIAFLIGIAWVLFQPSWPEEAIVQEEEYLISSDYRKAADSAQLLMEEVIHSLRLPSVSVAVQVKGERVWAATWGFMDVKKRMPATLETQYRAGSVSKSMAGLATARLVAEGQIELDEPIGTYLSSFPPLPIQPTLRQLASHTGGIRHYSQPGHPAFFQEQFSKKHYSSVREALGMFLGDSLLYKPGQGFQYSTHGFTLLSAGLEQATGKTYLSLVHQLVWEPSNMQYTSPDDLTQTFPNRAIPYTQVMKHLVYLEGPDPSYKWAGGGILTTPSDLVAMGDAFLTGALTPLSPQDSLFRPIPLIGGEPNPQNYAMGFRNDREDELLGYDQKVHVMHHGGSSPGGSSFLLMVPGDTLSASTMTNLSLRQAWPLRKAVCRIAGIFGKVNQKQD